MAQEDPKDEKIKTLTAADIHLLKTVRQPRPRAWARLTAPCRRATSSGSVISGCQPLPGAAAAPAPPPLPPPPAHPPLGRAPAAHSALTPCRVQYGAGPYSSKIKKLEGDIKEIAKKVNEVSGIKESDTGLAHPSRWDLVSDKQAQQEEQPLQVRARPRRSRVCVGWRRGLRRAPRAAAAFSRARCRAGGCASNRRRPRHRSRASNACAPPRWRAAPRSSTPTPTTPST